MAVKGNVFKSPSLRRRPGRSKAERAKAKKQDGKHGNYSFCLCCATRRAKMDIPMADIKLFRISSSRVQELQGKSATVEKSLQNQIEGHMEEFLGIRFLASEYTTGRSHSGRIDTLGIDENGSPVVVEYKRTL